LDFVEELDADVHKQGCIHHHEFIFQINLIQWIWCIHGIGVLAQGKRWCFKLRVYKVCSLVNKDIIFVIHKCAKIVNYKQETITKAKKSMVILTLFWGLLVCQIVHSMQEIVVKANKSMVVLK
jgi:hypothetical protein